LNSHKLTQQRNDTALQNRGSPSRYCIAPIEIKQSQNTSKEDDGTPEIIIGNKFNTVTMGAGQH
jgi:hypothetical protein